MRGFTKAQLTEKARNVKHYRWCSRCRLYWNRRGFANHRHVSTDEMKVQFRVPPTVRLRKGCVAIIHPAYESFISLLADLLIKDLLSEQPEQAAGSSLPSARVSRPAKRSKPARGATRKPVYDVLTVDEAVAKLGMTREEIMAEFDDVLRRNEMTSAEVGGSAATSGEPGPKD